MELPPPPEQDELQASNGPVPAPSTTQNMTPADSRRKAPVLNVADALARLGGDQGLLRDMAQFFLEDTGKLLEELENALQTGELERARRHAHSLKGLSANFNAETCVDTAFAIENACVSGDSNTAKGLLPDLRSEIARLIEALEREILNS